MSQCQHGNLKIVERSLVETHYEFSDGEPPEAGDGFEYNPVLFGIEVRCWDCDFQHFYGLEAKRPKWVQDAYDAIFKEQTRYAHDLTAHFR